MEVIDEIQIAINELKSHDMLEEAEKLEEIASICNCVACKERRNQNDE